MYSENGTKISSFLPSAQARRRIRHRETGFGEIRGLLRAEDVERIALAKGIRYHVHDRTLIDGHRAIVFPD